MSRTGGFHHPAESWAVVPDTVDLSTRVGFLFGERSALGVGAGMPLTGPRFYDYQPQLGLSVRY